MPEYKVDYVFENQNGGWTESFYATYASPGNAISGAFAAAPARCLMLAAKALMLEIRVSDDAIKGDSKIDTRCQALPTTALPGDVLNSATLVRLEAGGLHRRGYLIRGYPDDWIKANNDGTNMVLLAVGRTALDEWLAQIAGSSPYQLRVKARRGEAPPGGTPSVTRPIAGFEALDEDGTATVVELNGVGVTPDPGTTVYFAGCRRTCRALNGAWPVIAATVVGGATFLTIPLVWGRISFGIEDDYVKGVGYIPQYFYPQITAAIYERVSSRKTGRPFDLPRGRSRPRAR